MGHGLQAEYSSPKAAIEDSPDGKILPQNVGETLPEKLGADHWKCVAYEPKSAQADVIKGYPNAKVLPAEIDGSLIKSGVLPVIELDGVVNQVRAHLAKTPADGKMLLSKDFAKVDADSNGFVTGDEIAKYAKSDGLTQAAVRSLEQTKAKTGQLEELSNDEWGDENDGITAADLDIAIKHERALKYADSLFHLMDKDQDDFVNSDEIDAYAKGRGKLSAEEAEKMQYLKDNMGDLEEAHDDEAWDENSGITRRDLLQSAADCGVNI